ncbi:MAG: Cof-type HAD-IIB family hydrolase [Oscillospiraceae bacterium]|nr:Cof-type HAD-IIB family hydrolase [Oscillospiraceae bacterium]
MKPIYDETLTQSSAPAENIDQSHNEKGSRYKMIAVDMDGTLLNKESQLTERTEAAIKKAVEAGVIYVQATGRAPKGVEIVNKLFDKDLPFIVYNGASAVMGKSRKVLFNEFLDASLAKEVFDIGRTRNIPVITWTKDGIFASMECQQAADYKNRYNMELPIINSINEVDGESIFKLFWIDTPEAVRSLQSEMNAFFGDRLGCYSSQPEFLEFVSPNAGKGAALERVGKLFGIDRNEMIAVGDGYNDISMLCYAGLGVAMENAPDDVKAVCEHVTLSNNDDGVAAVIEQFILR